MPTTLQFAVSHLVAFSPDARTDANLMRAFLQSADQAAFAELVRRHGPVVLGVCRRFLGNTPDADDAFQATFLVLVRRARSTDWRESLGPWLYGVALRVARKARALRARRRTNERQATTMTTDPPTPFEEPTDTAAVIDEELGTLPVNYRRALVLCEIQGLNRRDAARELGITEGTLSSRLARGRKLLRERLVRRGLVPAMAGLAVAVPSNLASATVGNALSVLSCAVGTVPAEILSLTEGAVKTMIVKWKLGVVLVMAFIGVTGFGAWRDSAMPTATANPPAAKLSPQPNSPAKRNPPQETKPNAPFVAVVGDVPVSREAFADYLIRRYGKKELEQFVNKQIIAQAFAQKGWTINPDEILAALDADCKSLGMTRDEFAKNVLPRYSKTLEDWAEDTIIPRIMLSRLYKEKISAVTEAELRQAFKTKYGEKIKCRVIVWKQQEAKDAMKMYEKIRDNDVAFDTYATRQSDPNLAANGGRIPPISRTLPPDANEVVQAAVKLQPGEISPPIHAPEGVVAVKCDGVIPADKSKVFETEKHQILAEVIQEKIDREIPKFFNELKKQAKPQYHLTFPNSASLPNPVPSKP